MELHELSEEEMKKVEGGNHEHPAADTRYDAWVNKGAVNPGVKSTAILVETGPGHNNGQGN